MFFVVEEEEVEEVREEAPLALFGVGATWPGGIEEVVEERLPPGFTC